MTNPTMMLITSTWGDKKTFRLMRMDNNCPFVEGIYDPDSKVLVMISNEKKQSYHMLAKLDENGDPMKLKKQRTSPMAKPYPEERRMVETYQEFYITETKEMEEIIKATAINHETFPYTEYMNNQKIIIPEKPKVEIIQ